MVIFTTFEAAVHLLCVLRDPEFPGNTTPESKPFRTDPLAADMTPLTREQCLQGIDEALKRLQTLAVVSKMADSGAQIITGLKAKTSDTGSPSSVMQSLLEDAMSVTSGSMMNGYLDPFSMPEPLAAVPEPSTSSARTSLDVFGNDVMPLLPADWTGGI